WFFDHFINHPESGFDSIPHRDHDFQLDLRFGLQLDLLLALLENLEGVLQMFANALPRRHFAVAFDFFDFGFPEPAAFFLGTISSAGAAVGSAAATSGTFASVAFAVTSR